MKVLPELNLNKHPEACTNGSLIYANNIMVSSDNVALQSENIIKDHTLNVKLNELISYSDYKIIHCVECSKELVMFIRGGDTINEEFKWNDFLEVFRYNEEENDIENTDIKIEYNGGSFVSTFTYNNENLIIVFSEYNDDDSLNVPLKTIELGKFKNDSNNYKTNNIRFQPICPKITIPTISCYEYKNISNYKGWYFIYIRYKITRDTYTNWFDTFCSYLNDESSKKTIIKYKTNSKDYDYELQISDELDICNKSIKCSILSNDLNYSEFQLAYVIIRKNFTKVFRTNDLELSDYNNYILNPKIDIEVSLSEILNNSNNYYNVKTINNFNNKLYISNYTENTNEEIVKWLKEKPKLLIRDIKENSSFTARIQIKNSKYFNDCDIIVPCYFKNNYFYFDNKNIICFELVGGDYVYYDMETEEGNVETIVGFTNPKFNVKTISYDYPTNINYNCFVEYQDNFYLTNINNSFNNLKQVIGRKRKCTKQRIKTLYNESYYYFDIDEKESYGVLTQGEYDSPIFMTQENVSNITFNKGNSLYYKKEIINDVETKVEVLEDFCRCGPSVIIETYTGVYTRYYLNPGFNEEMASDLKYIISETGMNFTHGNQQPYSNIHDGDISIGILKNQYYNFFVHFIDEYGKISNGYNLSNFDVTFEDGEENLILHTNNINNTILEISRNSNPASLLTFSIENKLKKYPYWFVSYENIDINDKYLCYSHGSYRGYSPQFDIYDEISNNINKEIRLGKYNNDNELIDWSINGLATRSIDWSDLEIDTEISHSKLDLRHADSSNNIGDFTNCNANARHTIFILRYEPETINNLINAYNNTNKKLIPCSNISINNLCIINTKTSFKTDCYFFHPLSGKDYGEFHTNATFDDEIIDITNYNNLKISYDDVYNCYLLGTIDKGFGKTVRNPAFVLGIIKDAWMPIQLNYKNINNKPDVVVTLLNTESPSKIIINNSGTNNKTYEYTNQYDNFAINNVVRIKNFIDLFEYKHLSYYDAYPTPLDWHNENLIYETKFPKTIRRSNIIQDESYNNAWRQFNVENYKIISENKGDVIKLISIGNILFAHTEHSLYMFSGNDALKPADDKNNNIQLASVDIWDINYKEVVSSVLGKCGIYKENHGIVGEFGYVWFDKDSNHIYRFDNNKLEVIDTNIRNFLLNYKFDDVDLVEDKYNNRLLFKFIKNNEYYIVSYNYNVNTFISFHDTKYKKGYSTKTNIYLIDEYNGADQIRTFYTNDVNYHKNCTISFMCNTNYYTIKKLEYVIYNIKKIINQNIGDFSPVEEIDNCYCGDTIRVYNNIFDTGKLDISGITKENVNSDYTKPYSRFGNWHFNYLRNILENAEDSLCYGNYFIVEFIFNTNNKVEIENIDLSFNNGELQ